MGIDYAIPDDTAELNKLYDKLTFNQKVSFRYFTEALNDMCPIKGCPDIWRIHAQAWFLKEGYELEHCAHKTVESLMGWADDTLTKLVEMITDVNEDTQNN